MGTEMYVDTGWWLEDVFVVCICVSYFLTLCWHVVRHLAPRLVRLEGVVCAHRARHGAVHFRPHKSPCVLPCGEPCVVV